MRMITEIAEQLVAQKVAQLFLLPTAAPVGLGVFGSCRLRSHQRG